MSLTTPTALGFEAARQLSNFVAIRWFDAAPRVNEWFVTLADAYSAKFDDDCGRHISLPDGATGPDGQDWDEAGNILDDFNQWLGRDVIYEIYDFVCEENGLCDHEYNAYCGDCGTDAEVVTVDAAANELECQDCGSIWFNDKEVRS